jgi:hypothetical protein
VYLLTRSGKRLVGEKRHWNKDVKIIEVSEVVNILEFFFEKTLTHHCLYFWINHNYLIFFARFTLLIELPSFVIHHNRMILLIGERKKNKRIS